MTLRTTSRSACLFFSSRSRSKFRDAVKVIFDCALVAPGHEDKLSDARRHRFLHGILNQRFVDDRQHFFGHCLGGR